MAMGWFKVGVPNFYNLLYLKSCFPPQENISNYNRLRGIQIKIFYHPVIGTHLKTWKEEENYNQSKL